MITERMQEFAGVPVNENKESVIKKHLYDTGTGISNIGDRYMFIYDDWEFRGYEPDDMVFIMSSP